MAAFVPVRLPLASAVRPSFPPYPLVRLVLQVSIWPVFSSADRAVLNELALSVKTINAKVDKIMSEDATIAATAADIEADVTALKTAMASSAALIASLQAEIAAGTTAVSDATMAALAQAKTDLDAVAAPPAAS